MMCAKATIPLLAVAATLGLGGCVDMFTSVPPKDATEWRGTTSAGNPAYPECAAFELVLGQYAQPSFVYQTVSGRAWPAAAPDTRLGQLTETYTQWWLEGYVTGRNFVEFETKMQQPVYFGARPYSVWRGNIDNDRMTLTESGSPCQREVVLLKS